MNKLVSISRTLVFSGATSICINTNIEVYKKYNSVNDTVGANSVQSLALYGILNNLFTQVPFIGISTYIAPVICYVVLLEYSNMYFSRKLTVANKRPD
jgi:hypothetical protein